MDRTYLETTGVRPGRGVISKERLSPRTTGKARTTSIGKSTRAGPEEEGGSRKNHVQNKRGDPMRPPDAVLAKQQYWEAPMPREQKDILLKRERGAPA